MKKKLRRFLEIIGGGILLFAGIIMLVTPGQGILAIIAGIFLISPRHGRRVVWHLRQIWKRVKMWWFSWKFKRTVKRKNFRKAKRIKSKD